MNAVHLGHRLITLPGIGDFVLPFVIGGAAQVGGLKNSLERGKRELSFNSLADSCSKLRRVDSAAALRPEGNRFLQMVDMSGIKVRATLDSRLVFVIFFRCSENKITLERGTSSSHGDRTYCTYR